MKKNYNLEKAKPQAVKNQCLPKFQEKGGEINRYSTEDF